jgi:hypothetical protein
MTPVNTTPQPKYPKEDAQELVRFKRIIKNSAIATQVQLPNRHVLEPHRDHRHYDLHMTEVTGMTIINTFHFKTKIACLEAMDHTEALLPEEESDNERQDS